MSYFEQLGVNFQYNSRSIEEATKNFERSCDKCCNTGKHIECDRCHIASVHNDVLLILSN